MGCFGGWVSARTRKVPEATSGLFTPWECQNFCNPAEKSLFKIL